MCNLLVNLIYRIGWLNLILALERTKETLKCFFKHITFSVCCRTEINDNVIMNPCVRTVHSLVKKTTVLVREMYVNSLGCTVIRYVHENVVYWKIKLTVVPV